MKLAAGLPSGPLNLRSLSVGVCIGALLAGCNGVAGYTFDSNGSGSSSGTGSGTSTSSSSGSSTTPPTPTYTVSGTVSGLATGSTGFIIQAGTGIALPIQTNGQFVFAHGFAPGDPYQVTVQTPPGMPAQFCRVAAPTGVVSNADVTNVAISCAAVGKFLFAANPFDNQGNGSIAAFAIDPASGGLTAVAGSPYVPAELNPLDIALDPTGQYLYVANSGSASVSTDSIDADGELTLDVTPAASTGTSSNEPSSLAIDPNGPYVYVGSNDNPLGTVEAYTLAGGVLTPAGGTLAASVYPAGNNPYSMAVDATTGLLFGATVYDGNYFDYTIAAGGTLNGVAGSPFVFQQGLPVNTAYAVATYPGARRLYVTDSTADSVSLYTYDAQGVTTLSAVYSIGALGGLTPNGLVVDATGTLLYVANSGSGSVSAFAIDPKTGTLKPAPGSPFMTTGVASTYTPMSVRIDPSSQYVYVSNGDAGTISVFAVNFSTGTLTSVGAPVSSIMASGGTGGPSALAIE